MIGNAVAQQNIVDTSWRIVEKSIETDRSGHVGSWHIELGGNLGNRSVGDKTDALLDGYQDLKKAGRIAAETRDRVTDVRR